MALERIQANNNAFDSNAANVSASTDPRQMRHDTNEMLIRGAAAASAMDELGLTVEETMTALNRKNRRKNERKTRNEEEKRRLAQWNQSQKSVFDQEFKQELDDARVISNDEAAVLGDKGEIAQDMLQNFGGVDPITGRTKSAEIAQAERAGARGKSYADPNEFTVFRKRRDGSSVPETIYVPEGQKTPKSAADEAILKSYGLRKFKTGQEEVLDKRGEQVYAKDGTPMFRNTYDAAPILSETGRQQTSVAQNSLNRIYEKLNTGELTLETLIPGSNVSVANLISKLEDELDPGSTIRNMKSEAEILARSDRALPRKGDVVIANERGARDARRRSELVRRVFPDDVSAIPRQGETGVESPRQFMARPQAVQLNEDAALIAQALGDDVSSYVDMASGQPIPGVDRTRDTGVNTPDTAQQLNAPQIGTGGQFVADRVFETDNTGQYRQVDLIGTTGSFQKQLAKLSPQLAGTPVRNVQQFNAAVQSAIGAIRQKGGKAQNFYLKDPNTGRNVFIAEPGAEEVLQKMRYSEPEKEVLANALYQLQMAQQSGIGVGPQQAGSVGANKSLFFVGDGPRTTPVSQGVQLNYGEMPEESATQFGKVGSSTRQAQFRALADPDAQQPFIGLERGVKDTPARQVMRGRTPEQLEAVMREQAADNNKPIDMVKLERYKRENAELRADQGRTDEDQSIRRVMAQADAPMSPTQQRAYDASQYPADTTGGSMPEAERRLLFSLDGPEQGPSYRGSTEDRRRQNVIEAINTQNKRRRIGGYSALGLGASALIGNEINKRNQEEIYV